LEGKELNVTPAGGIAGIGNPSFTRPPGKYSSWFFVPSAIHTSPLAATLTPITGQMMSPSTGMALIRRWSSRLPEFGSLRVFRYESASYDQAPRSKQ
jgi:hypothetical protein